MRADALRYLSWVFVIALAVSVTALDGPAQAAGGGKEAEEGAEEEQASGFRHKRSFGRRELGPAYVQMRPIMAPIRRTQKSKTRQAPVTVVLTLSENAQVRNVCDLSPRINNALLRAWFSKPVELSYLFQPEKENKSQNARTRANKTSAQQEEDARLIKAINTALGADHVSEILVFLGTRRQVEGSISRLPFSRNCAELERAEEPPAEKKDGG